MAIDSSHPNCFERRDGLYVLDEPSAAARAQELTYDEWDARVKSRMPLARIGWGWYTPYTRYGTPVLLGLAGFLLVGYVFRWPLVVAILISVVLVAIGIPWGRSTARVERASAEQDRLVRAVRLAGPMPPAPSATRIPQTVAEAAPADSTSAQLRDWSRVIADYESRVERLPVVRREWRVPTYIGRGEYSRGFDDVVDFERHLRALRPAYLSAMSELGAVPQPEPSGLA